MYIPLTSTPVNNVWVHLSSPILLPTVCVSPTHFIGELVWIEASTKLKHPQTHRKTSLELKPKFNINFSYHKNSFKLHVHCNSGTPLYSGHHWEQHFGRYIEVAFVEGLLWICTFGTWMCGCYIAVGLSWFRYYDICMHNLRGIPSSCCEGVQNLAAIFVTLTLVAGGAANFCILPEGFAGSETTVPCQIFLPCHFPTKHP